VNRVKQAAIIYWSKTGNTEKVAFAVKEGLDRAGLKVTLLRTEDAEDLDLYAYDLICIGSPSYQWHPPQPVTNFLQKKFEQYRRLGRIKLGAPTIPGQNVLIFCTYSGPHTGLNEAIPVGKYIGQFFEHLGFTIRAEWYVLSEFYGSVERSTQGRLGDIRGKPTEDDLNKIREDAEALAHRL
jgi:hypothetical protein